MKKKYLFLALFFLIAMLLGFLLGRLSIKDNDVVETKETIKFVPSVSIISDTIFRPIPKNVFIRDTVYEKVVSIREVDTAAILRDYYLSRQYSLDFSNDTLGVFKVDAEVNQNKLISANSYIRPIVKTVYSEKTITQYNTKFIQPYLTIGTNLNFNVQKVTLGVDLKSRYLLGVSGIRWDDKYNYTIDLGIKF